MAFAIIGHRGAMAEAPENTIASYRVAEEVGVDEVETDVRISSDGQLFMLHDATLDRVAAEPDGKDLGPVAELTWAKISSVDVGDGERVPTLEQMYQATTRLIQLEIKALGAIDGLADFFPHHPDYAKRTILTSFSVEAMAAVAEKLPEIPRGIIVSNWTDAEAHPGGYRKLIEDTGSSRIHSGGQGLTAEVVHRLHDEDVPVHGWPTRNADDLRHWLELGVDGTTTDDPRTLRRWLAEARR
ncbi:glycerophosphodiester phosphodiesterase [Nonomuraea sp. MG754425]|uniref:glycerophosphodiester phosphodiesterase n=1 Tax=Nonomuraea sp. MG754425 TaxID=2570319 RepID=UPI001F233F25|nr:glycerophosphodiester phosphodiesterase family protein [Nonomuraea sp. MG754425]MCF6468281.1 glycerophosphodiester phosphodiesterase [Nonomuraea sp. MG754425]